MALKYSFRKAIWQKPHIFLKKYFLNAFISFDELLCGEPVIQNTDLEQKINQKISTVKVQLTI